MVDVAALSRGNLRRLALSIALAALGVACLVAVTMTGPARVPAGFTLLEKNPAKSIQNRAARSAAQRTIRQQPKGVRMQRKPIRTTPAMAKAAKMAKAATKKKQSLAITMNGETPISNDDFDGAGYNMDGIWDWSERRFRQNAVKPHTYFEDLGLDMPTCEPNESALKATVFEQCGTDPYSQWECSTEDVCYTWWGRQYCWCPWYARYRIVYYEMEMPTAGIEIGPGDYAVLGAECIDDRPQGVIIERTKNAAAIEGGCVKTDCGIHENAIEALELPEGLSATLFTEEDFMGEHLSFQGPIQIHCLDRPYRSWIGGRIRSMKISKTVGFETEEPTPVDRIHDSNWIYPGGPDSSGVRHDEYFNQWDDVVGMPRGDMEDPEENYQWKELSPMASDLNPGALEVWQADVNNLY